tara:strand:- start:51 stop:209 length:159 start_codon:yes stop_codon:yes gene_type:complete
VVLDRLIQQRQRLAKNAADFYEFLGEKYVRSIVRGWFGVVIGFQCSAMVKIE